MAIKETEKFRLTDKEANVVSLANKEVCSTCYFIAGNVKHDHKGYYILYDALRFGRYVHLQELIGRLIF